MHPNYRKLARERIAAVRAVAPKVAATPENVTDLAFLLEQAMGALDAAEGAAEADIWSGVLTIGDLNAILEEIGDANLAAFFQKKVAAAMTARAKAGAQAKIARDDAEA